MKGFLGIDPKGTLDKNSNQNGYQTEIQTCSECEQFKNMKRGFPICRKKLMVVLANMHVYYKIDDGTCFESK
jgi:hypothetical protein